LKALDKLDEVPLLQLNLGTGKGFSNLQVVEAVKRISRRPLTPKIGPRRPGDPAELVADASQARTLLGWKPVRTDLDRIVSEVLQWFTQHPQGYAD
jgi:UDP-glucose 4-epimerase